MKVLDVKGMKCPMPLIETKKALKELREGETLKILIDNDTSARNVIHYLNDHNLPVNQVRNGPVTELTVNNTGDRSFESADAEMYCETPQPAGDSYVVMFAKDRLGEGSEELGQALAGSLLNTLRAADNQPAKIIFMNSGINLVTEGSLFLPQLRELEQKGVTVITCGTCLDYYGKMDKLAVGRVTNMAEILDSMLSASRIINI